MRTLIPFFLLFFSLSEKPVLAAEPTAEPVTDSVLVKYIVSGSGDLYPNRFKDRLQKAVDDLRVKERIFEAYHPHWTIENSECVNDCQVQILFTGPSFQIETKINEIFKSNDVNIDKIIEGKSVYVGLRAELSLYDSSGKHIGRIFCDQPLKAYSDWRNGLFEINDAIFSQIPDERETRMNWFKSFVTCPFDESAANSFDLVTIIATEPNCSAPTEVNKNSCLLGYGFSRLGAGYPARK